MNKTPFTFPNHPAFWKTGWDRLAKKLGPAWDDLPDNKRTRIVDKIAHSIVNSVVKERATSHH